ncbi:MAG: PAS domain S-box protein [Methanoregula sp.]|nr:PAS domain S-box protein [Methanoregula sp.]
MNLRLKLLVSIGLIFTIAIIIIAAFSFTILDSDYHGQEQDQTKHTVLLAERSINERAAVFSANLRDYAAWNDTYRFVQDGNEAWIDANMRDEVFRMYDVDYILLFNRSNQLVYAKGFENRESREMPVPPGLIDDIRRLNDKQHIFQADTGSSGILASSAGPVLAASHPILTDAFQGPAAGSMHLIRKADSRFMAGLTEGADHIAYLIPSPEIRETSYRGKAVAMIAAGEPVVVLPSGGQNISGFTTIPEMADGSPYYLEVSGPRSLYLAGQAAIQKFLLAFLITGVILTICILVIVDRIVLARVNAISRKITDQSGSSGSGSDRLQPRGDELAELAMSIDPIFAELAKANREIRDRQERLVMALGAAEIGIWSWNLDTDERHIYTAGRMIFGYSEVELEDYFQHIRERSHPEDPALPGDSKDICQNLPPDGTYEFERRIFAKDGTWNCMIVKGSIISRGPEGCPALLAGTFRDITGKKRGELELRESEKRYRLLADHLEDIIWTADMNMRLTYISPSVQKVLGFLPDEALTVPPELAFTPASYRRLIESRAKGRREITGPSVTYPNHLLELDMNRKDGSTVPVEISITLVWGEGGVPVGVVGVTRDITRRKEAERALRESEELYRVIVSASPEGISIMDRDHHLTFISPRVREIFLFPADMDSRTIRITDWIDPVFLPVAHQRIDDLIAGKALRATEEYRFFRSDRTMFWGEMTSAPLYDADGHISGLLTIIRDVTEIREARDVLRMSEEKYRSIIREMQDVFYRVSLDGTLLMVSPKGAHIMGYPSVEAMVGINIVTDVYADPKDRERFLDAIRQTGSVENLEIDLKSLNGRIFTVTASSHFFTDADGKIAGIEGVLHDITEQKNAERVLRENEERYRSLVESTSDLIWQTDVDGRYTYISPMIRNVLGFDQTEVLGKTPFDLMPPGEATRVRELFAGFEGKRQSFAGLDNINLHKDGRRIIIETSGEPVLGPDGEFRGYRGIDRDITRRKQVEEQLRLSEQSYRGLFNTIREAVYIQNTEGIFVDVNDGALAMYGYTRDDIVGKTPEFLSAPG